jgi:hypothetical protein
MFYTDSKVEGAEAKASDGAVVLVAAAAQGKGKDMAVWGFGHAAVPCRYGKWHPRPRYGGERTQGFSSALENLSAAYIARHFIGPSLNNRY